MDRVSSEYKLFAQSGERLIRFYVRLVAQAEKKLQPSSRYKLDQEQNSSTSIDMNIQLLNEAQALLEAEWDNLLNIYELIKASGDQKLLIEYIDSLLPYLGYRGDWIRLGLWLKQGIHSAEACQDPESLTSYLLEMGWLAIDKGDWENGLHYYNRVLKLLEETPFPFVEALTYLRLGWFYDSRGERNKAQQSFEKSLALYKELDSPIGIANATLGLGNVFSEIQELDEADRQFKIALELYDQIGDSTGVASAYNNLALLAARRNDLTTAREYYIKDHGIMERVQEKQSLAKTEQALGGLEIQLGNHEAGMKYLLAACAAFSELGSHPDLANTYWGLAAGYMKQNRPDVAIEYLCWALEIYERLDATRSIAEANRQLGFALSTIGEQERAEEHFRIAHEKFGQLNDPRGVEKDIIRNASNVLESEREFPILLDFYQKTRNKIKALGSTRGLAQIDIALGDTWAKKNEYFHEAIISYEEALSLFESLHDLSGIAEARDKLGEIYRSLGEWDNAIANYNLAVSLYKSLGDDFRLGWVCSWLGQCHAEKREWDQALQAHKQSMDARRAKGDESGMAWSYLDIGGLFKQQEIWGEAITQYQEALFLGTKINHLSLCGWACEHLGDIYLENQDAEQTLHYYLEAKRLRSQSSDRTMYRRSITSIGRAHLRFGQLEEAANAFEEALQIAEDVDDLKNIEDRYIDLANSYEELKRYDEALHLYQNAERHLKANNNFTGLVFLLYRVARMHETRKEYAEAISCYQELLSAAKTATVTDENIASAYGLLGDAYFENGERNKAIDSYHECLRILEKVDAPAAKAGAYLGLGIIYGELGWTEQEIEAHKKALMYIEKVGSSNDLGLYHRWLADSYYKANQYTLAIDHYLLSLGIFEQEKDMEEIIRVHGKIASAYSKTGVEEKVKEHLTTAVWLLDQVVDPDTKEEAINYLRSLFTPKT